MVLKLRSDILVRLVWGNFEIYMWFNRILLGYLVQFGGVGDVGGFRINFVEFLFFCIMCGIIYIGFIKSKIFKIIFFVSSIIQL